MNTKDLVNGAGWLGVSKILIQAASFFANLYVANKVGPAGYALAGVGLTISYFIDNIAEFGLGVAIISKHSITEHEISASFYINVALGILLCVLCLFGAGHLEAFFGIGGLQSFLQILAPGVSLRATAVVPYKLLEKELKFRQKSTIDVIAKGISSGVIIGLAHLDVGVASIAYGQLVHGATMVFLSFIYKPYAPSLYFTYSQVKELLTFSIKVFFLKVTWYFKNQADQLVGAKFLPVEGYGAYTMGFQLARNIQDILHSVINTLALPVLASVERDRNVFRGMVAKLIKYSAIVALPFFVGGAICSEMIIDALFDKSWHAAILTFQFACLVQIFRIMTSLYENVFIALNRIDFTIVLNVTTIIVQFVVCIGGTMFGVTGLCSVWLALSVSSFVFWSYLVAREVDFSLDFVSTLFAVPLTATCAMAVTVNSFLSLGTYILGNASSKIILTTAILIGAVVYVAISLFSLPELRATVKRKIFGEQYD